ncbi:hypothetical protein G6O69_11815 [Pseudenhygromyxa sp. WMMC2535]|uniref:RCC1 domain-containing protein n=1 Tax=Pseudenhygromyxa sp. WMMC2535 TaxID=2712867 RepID=UPI001554928C|nr:hypothetical protein [Pseudenhygromyxa sp. WMMC2535]NVB38518.1 hypothetical protein [Pseudenhygromyxa sp. WMMC2535]
MQASRTILLALMFASACFDPQQTPADDDVGDSGPDASGSDAGMSTSTEDDSAEDEPAADTGESAGECPGLGCPCAGAGSCEHGQYCYDGQCILGACGDGERQGPEQCDDANLIDDDGCDADCSFTELLDVQTARGSTCVLLEGGRVRCWGRNDAGQLGYGHTETIGDDESAAVLADVALPEPVVALSMGERHVCVLMADQGARCWGAGERGRLGYGGTEDIGDDETPLALTDVPLGEPVLGIQAGERHTCALLEGGRLRCWGAGDDGRLGYASDEDLGDDELPASVGDVTVGEQVVGLALGGDHTCALVDTGKIRCWGSGALGQLGYGSDKSVGEQETPASVGDVPAVPEDAGLDTPALALSLGLDTSCARFEGGSALCWGAGERGQLGQSQTTNLGDDELPSTAPAIVLPGPLRSLLAGDAHVCALLESDQALCWGANDSGQLGYGHTEDIGDDEPPASAGLLALGGPVKAISAGGDHTCAILSETNELLCWGRNDFGQLGYGHTQDIGDDELPPDVGSVPLFE